LTPVEKRIQDICLDQANKQLQVIIARAKREQAREIKAQIIKETKYIEKLSNTYVGTSTSTGGRINLSETYLVIPESKFNSILAKYCEEK
jgi:hypothetical protein